MYAVYNSSTSIDQVGLCLLYVLHYILQVQMFSFKY